MLTFILRRQIWCYCLYIMLFRDGRTLNTAKRADTRELHSARELVSCHVLENDAQKSWKCSSIQYWKSSVCAGL